MKQILIVTVVIFAVGWPGWGFAQNDVSAVRAAVLDYVEGIYECAPERIARSVHPELNKHGFSLKDGSYRWVSMTYERLMEVAEKYNANGRIPSDAPKEVEVYDVNDQTASAKITAYWGIDYLQLGKFDGKWKIINVLWQTPPPQNATEDSMKMRGVELERKNKSDRQGHSISEIRLERTPCYGACPVYKVILKSDGTFIYEGRNFVDRVGMHQGKVNLWSLNQLARFIEDGDFMNLENEYSRPITDMPTTYTTVVLKTGEEKRVKNYGNSAPPQLWAIEQLIDKIVEEAQWESE